jgi:hypothetical protein
MSSCWKLTPETGPVTVDRTTVIKINESIEAFKEFDQSLNDKDQYALYISTTIVKFVVCTMKRTCIRVRCWTKFSRIMCHVCFGTWHMRRVPCTKGFFILLGKSRLRFLQLVCIEAFKEFDQSLNDKDQYALYISKC